MSSSRRSSDTFFFCVQLIQVYTPEHLELFFSIFLVFSTLHFMSLQPTCLLCLSPCDGNSFLTSCEHFFCSRCTQQLNHPQAGLHKKLSSSDSATLSGMVCPICKARGYQLLPVTHKSLRPLFQDAAAAISQSQRVLTSQLRHYRQVHRRMSEALKALSKKCSDMEKNLRLTTQELGDTKETLRTVQQYTQKQKKEIDALSQQRGNSHPSDPRYGHPCPGSHRGTSHGSGGRQISEDPQWVQQMMRGSTPIALSQVPTEPLLYDRAPNPSLFTPQGYRVPSPHDSQGAGMHSNRFTAPSRGDSNSSAAFPGSFGWSAVSSVLKRPREADSQSSHRPSNQSPAQTNPAVPSHRFPSATCFSMPPSTDSPSVSRVQPSRSPNPTPPAPATCDAKLYKKNVFLREEKGGRVPTRGIVPQNSEADLCAHPPSALQGLLHSNVHR